MRILHIISSPAAGGAEIFVKDLSIEMKKKGCEIFILFVSHASEIDRSPEFEKDYLEEISRYGIQFDFIGNACKRNPFKGIFKLRKVVKYFSPDVVHSHLYYGAVFSLFCGVDNKVYTHHNIDINANKRIYKILDLGIKKYIGICEACEIILKQLTSHIVFRIDNAVNEERVIKKTFSEKPINSKVNILMIGRLTLQKNYKLMLSAVKKIQNLDFHLSIIGEGELMEDLKEYVLINEISSMVTFLGNRSDVNVRLTQADIFAMSSSWEGLPISLIEATLCGLPVIVTDVGGCSEVVNNVGNGVVVKNLSVEEYSAALQRLIQNESLRKEYHLNALKNSSIYTIAHAVEKHFELYKY